MNGRSARRTGRAAVEADLAPWRTLARETFLYWGLMIPVWLPTLSTIGRALGNIILVAYLLWGLAALRSEDLKSYYSLTLVYLLVVAALFLGIPAAVEPGRAFADSVNLGAALLIVFFTPLCLDQGRYHGDPPAWAAASAALAMVVFMAALAYRSSQPDFDPAIHVDGMTAAALLPLAWPFLHRFGRAGDVMFGVLIAALLTALLLANSRTEILVAVTGCGVAVGVGLRRSGQSAVVMLLLAAILLLVHGLIWDKLPISGQLGLIGLDVWSSGRLSVWSVPWQFPPENPWIGIGLGNSRFFIEAAQLNLPAKHLHNVFLQLAYETGWLGSTAVLIMFGLLVRPLLVNGLGQGRQRIWGAALLGAAAGVGVGAVLDKDLLSLLVRVYLVFCLALLHAMSRSGKTAIP